MSRFQFSFIAVCALVFVFQCVEVQSIRLKAFKNQQRLTSPIISQLAQDTRMTVGTYLLSSDTKYVATMQSDCNFVVMDFFQSIFTPSITWSTGTTGKDTNCYMIAQSDSNLCIYGDRGFVWCTMKLNRAAPFPYHLEVHPNGNLAMIDGKGMNMWLNIPDTLDMDKSLAMGHSISSQNERYVAKLQDDCNFVVTDLVAGKALWSTSTAGRNPGCFIIPQTDTNLCMYNQNGFVWCTMKLTTGAPKPYRLVMTNTGKLVYYDANSKTLWSS